MKFKKIQDILCFLAILLLPWQARWIFHYQLLNGEQYEYGVMGVYAASLIVIAAVVSLIVFSNRAGQKPILSPPPKLRSASPRQAEQMLFSGREKNRLLPRLAVTAFILWLIINTLLAVDQSLAWYYLGTALIAFCYFFIGSQWSWQKILSALVISGVVQALIAWHQVITQSIYPNTFLGVAEHMPNVAGQSVVILFGTRFLRAYGLLPHPNILGAFLFLAFAAAVYQYVRVASHRYAANSKKHSEWFMSVAAVLFLFSGILISFSRSALIAAILLIGGWFLYEMLVRRTEVVTLAQLVTVCAALFFSCNMVADNAWLGRFSIRHSDNNLTEQIRLEERSITERFESYEQALLIMRTKGVVGGIGLGNYVPSLASLVPALPTYAYQPAHMVYMLIVVEIGIIGIVLLASCIGYALWKRWKESRHGLFRLYSFSILFLVAVLGLFDHYLWTQYVGQSVWWLAFGLALNRK